MKAVITVTGKDTVGILATVSTFCAGYSVNIIDVSQTVLQDIFTMAMMVDVSDCTIPFDDFKEKIGAEGQGKNLVIHVMHEDIFNAMHRI